MTQSPYHIIRVCKPHLRKVFWKHKLWERAISADGDLKAIMIRESMIDETIDFRDLTSGQIAWSHHCDRTQEMTFEDRHNGAEIARAHLYITDNGQIGASGAPDPKRIRIGNDYYRIVTAGNPCEMCAAEQASMTE